jgi:hypothetical protein
LRYIRILMELGAESKKPVCPRFNSVKSYQRGTTTLKAFAVRNAITLRRYLEDYKPR